MANVIVPCIQRQKQSKKSKLNQLWKSIHRDKKKLKIYFYSFLVNPVFNLQEHIWAHEKYNMYQQ